MPNRLAIGIQTAKGTAATALQTLPWDSLSNKTDYEKTKKKSRGNKNQNGRTTRKNPDAKLDFTVEMHEALPNSVWQWIMEGIFGSRLQGINGLITAPTISVVFDSDRWRIRDSADGLSDIFAGLRLRVWENVANNTNYSFGEVESATAGEVVMTEGTTLQPLAGNAALLGRRVENGEEKIYFTAMVESEVDGGTPIYWIYQDMLFSDWSKDFEGDAVNASFSLKGGSGGLAEDLSGLTITAPQGNPLKPQEGRSDHSYNNSYIEQISLSATKPVTSKYAVTQPEPHRSVTGTFGATFSVSFTSEQQFLDLYEDGATIPFHFAAAPQEAGGLMMMYSMPNAYVDDAEKSIDDEDKVGTVSLTLEAQAFNPVTRQEDDSILYGYVY